MHSGGPQRTVGGWAVALLLGALAGALLTHGGVTFIAGPLVASQGCAVGPAPGPAGVGLLPGAAPAGAGAVPLSVDVAAFAAAAGKVSTESLGERARFATSEWLLERNQVLKGELAASRRQFLWQAKTKMAQVKGLLKALKAKEENRALSFVLDDRDAPDGQALSPGLRMLQGKERRVVVQQFQEVDMPTNPDPMVISIRSLKQSIQSGQMAPLWPAIKKCSGALLRLSELAAQQARLAQATLDAQTQRELAGAAQGRVAQLWRGAGDWVAAWRDGQGPSEDRLQRFVAGALQRFTKRDAATRRERSEVAFWGLALEAMWPLPGANWSRVHGPSLPQLEEAGSEGQALVVDTLKNLTNAWEDDIRDLAVRSASVENLLQEALGAAQSACGAPNTVLQRVQLSASSSPLGPCASPELSRVKTRSALPLAPATAWKRQWVPDPWSELELLGQAEGAPAGTPVGTPVGVPGGSARGPVNASLLVVLQFPATGAGKHLERLFEACTRGLWGGGGEGSEWRMATEVLVAVDASMREQVTEMLAEQYKPWFLTRVVFVSTGGVGLTASQGYNVLASLARGEVLVLYELDFSTGRPNECQWLHKIVRPFGVWPRLAVVGQFKGHMAMNSTPWGDFLGMERSAGEALQNRLKDPLLQDRLQFLLGTFQPPMAFRRSMFLAVGGFDAAAAGASNMLLEYELCRRLWLSGLQVTLAHVLNDFRVMPAHKSEFMDAVWRGQAAGDLVSHVFSADLETRVVGEVKRMNRFLKPIAIWE